MNLPLKPTQEDFEGLDDEKSHLEHFRGRFTAGSAESPASVSGINLENGGCWGWMKYALGGVVLVLSAVYYWYPVGKTPELAGIEARKAEPQIVVKEAPQVQVRASPAVTVLEQNQDEINEKKAAELKHAILEKAYSTGETGRQGTTELAGPGDVAQTVSSKTDPGSAKDQGGKAVVVKELTPIATTGGTVQATETVARAQEKTITTAGPVAAAKDKEKIPVLPNKIVLPLAPNSLKFTSEANKEYKGFVEKLKAYPKAKLLVKGFVSSTSDSPENIKLSEERAMAVQKMLVAGGMETERIQIKGMGNQEPIASNDTNDGRTKNRRVEVVVVESGR